MLLKRATSAALTVLTLALLGCGGSRAAPASGESVEMSGDMVGIEIVNRTPDPVIVWYQFNRGRRVRLAEVTGPRPEETAFPMTDATAEVRFWARASARTRDEDRFFNTVAVVPGVRLILIVEAATMFVRHADSQRGSDGRDAGDGEP